MSLCHYVNKVFELTSQHEPDNATIVFVFFISLKKQIIMNDIQLSENFKLSEFTRSETARRRKINNDAPESVIENLRNLCQNVLQPLRDYVGEPITISSGYRCALVNSYVGSTIPTTTSSSSRPPTTSTSGSTFRAVATRNSTATTWFTT